MEDKKLLEVAICGYLPYGLNVRLSRVGKFNLDSGYPNEHSNKIGKVKFWAFDKDGFNGSFDVANNYGFEFDGLDEIEILLNPIECLTKPIKVEGYNDGKEFVPIEWLVENVNRNLRFSDNRFMDHDDGKDTNVLHYSFYDVFSEVVNIDEILELTNKLLEWHIDIYGLIAKGWAGDKTSTL